MMQPDQNQAIRDWIEQQLCRENDLLPGAFPMTEQIINRSGELCGTLYCLHGPRSVRLLAVHDWVSGRILTYDSRGVRTGGYDRETIIATCDPADAAMAAPASA